MDTSDETCPTLQSPEDMDIERHYSTYHFTASDEDVTNEQVTCNILWPERQFLDKYTINNFINTFYLLEMLTDQSQVIQFSTNFKTKISVTFCRPKEIGVANIIKRFISWLENQGCNDYYYSPDSGWFYSTPPGRQIMKVKNFTVDIKTYLEEERAIFTRILGNPKTEYNIVVEAGCGALTNIEVANCKTPKPRYIGIDFDTTEISNAQEKIRDTEGYENASAKYLTVLDISRQKLNIAQSESEKPLILFPFNLIGNVAPISKLICNMVTEKLDFVISLYTTTPRAVSMRRQYYENCGYRNIKHTIDPLKSSVFTSDTGMYTVAYDYAYIRNLLRSFGYLTNHYSIHNGNVIHATLRSPPDVK